MTRLGVIGVAANRRVVDVAAVARARGLDVAVVDWRNALEDPAGSARVLGDCNWVRLDSPGEDAVVERRLCGLDASLPFGVVAPMGRWRAGFAAALAALVDHGLDEGRLPAAPGDVLLAFDKVEAHRVMQAAGVPVPDAVPVACRSWSDVRSALVERGWSRAFVKPCAGSSAVGVVAVSGFRPAHLGGPLDRVVAHTTLCLDDDGAPYSTLRQRRVTGVDELARLVDAAADGGVQVQAWFPRASVDGRVLDLRVLVIAGRARHVVVRTGSGPMTNLHLGNARGATEAVQERMGAAWHLVADAAEAAARCVPGLLHVGVDVLVGQRFDRVTVAEINAFGDLLPGVLHEGRAAYEAELDALLDGTWPAWSAAA